MADEKAQGEPSCLLNKHQQYACRMAMIREAKAKKKCGKKKKVRKQKKQSSTRRSHRHTTARHQAKGKDPWVLVASPSLGVSAKQMVRIYAKRMTIEERFCDTKDARYGSGLLSSQSRSPIRIENLLMIDFLAKLVLWLVGCWADAQGYARLFQSNTVKNRRVLSLIRLDRELIDRGDRFKILIECQFVDNAFVLLKQFISIANLYEN